jgi:hypothetical protein
MSANNYHWFMLFLAGVLLWQFLSGKALSVWWRPNITRKENPGTHGLLRAAQVASFLGVLVTGTDTWHFR